MVGIVVNMANDRSGLPLADFFWIAGVDSLSYDKDDLSDGDESPDRRQSFIAPPIKEEDDGIENGFHHENPALNNGPSKASARHSRHGSNPKILNRPLSTVTTDSTDSRRSSQATITALNPQKGSDQDFNRAMKKFATEREDFLAELSFSAGAQTSSKATKLSKALRVKNEDPSQIRRSGMGGIARRISFRDMGSAKRQSSVGRSGQ